MSDLTVDWNSEPAGMMKVFQGQNYDLGQSISDLVDNGIDEGADTVEIIINPGEKEKDLFIAIFDNGSGISEHQIDDIMTLGHSTKTDSSKLGVFGVGLKLSSLAQANEVTIQSRVLGKAANLRRISAPYVLKRNENKLMKYPLVDADGKNSAAYEFCHKKMMEEDWTTFVLLEDIHSVDQFVAVNENYMTSLSKEIERIIVHLGLTFHRILEKSDIKIKIGTGGKSKKNIQPLHPGMPDETDLDFGTVSSGKQTIAYDYKDAELNIKVEYIILPHTKTIQNKASKKINLGYKRANDMQGLYIYRNDRLIQYGNWQGMFGDVNRNDEHAKLGKIFIDIPSDHIKLFGLNPTKTDVKLPKEFLRRLLEDSKRNRKWGPIEKGKELTFFDAFDKRYRKDGNAFIKRQQKNPVLEEKVDFETNVKAIADPQARVRERKKKLMPQKIITSIFESGNDVVLTFSGSKEEKQNFLESIKEWRAYE
jgi:hypothetical protein